MIAPSVVSCGGGAKKSSSKKEIGIQIYTIREQLNADLAGSLKKLSEIGYNSIEAAGFANAGGAYQFYGKSPKEFSKMLEDLGMKLISSHTAFDLD